MMVVGQIRELYEAMPARLARARRAWSRPFTLTEKILVAHALEPGRPVTVRIKKPDSQTLAIQMKHSLTREQIGWFRAGSALNAGQLVDPATGETAKMTAAAPAPTDRHRKPGKDV
jgi:hypothetical protein